MPRVRKRGRWMKTCCGDDSHRGASPSLPHLMGVKWMMSNLGRGAWPKEDHLPVVTLANTGFISLKLNGSPWWETNEWRSWSYSHCANQGFYDKSIAITAATYLQSIALLFTLPKNIFVWPKVQNPKIKTHSDWKTLTLQELHEAAELPHLSIKLLLLLLLLLL